MNDDVLRRHPGLNPAYFSGRAAREQVQAHNRTCWPLPPLRVPPLPNRYIPHYGAKEAMKYARRALVAGR